MEDHQVKLAVLDQKLEDLKPVILKIDAAIEKLSEVNTTVSRMKSTQYCLLKLTNSVIKWTGIMTSYCKEYVN
jgi:prefoldin subunit 5